MDIHHYLEVNKDNGRKYRYNKNLGYSEKAACVLAMLTYGMPSLSRMADSVSKAELLGKIYDVIEASETCNLFMALEYYLDHGVPYKKEVPSGMIDPEEADEDSVSLLHEQLKEILDVLTFREREVIELRFGFIDGQIHTLDEVARAFGITRERVRQIEARVLRKLRRTGGSDYRSRLRLNVDLSTAEPTGVVNAEEGLADCARESTKGGLPDYASESAVSYYRPDRVMNCISDLATDSYEQIEEKQASSIFTAPSSTFRMTTNTASMGVVFNQIRYGRRVSLSQVRIEEVLNYFDYGKTGPNEEKFAVYTELLPKGHDKELLFIRVQAKHEVKEHQNIVLLLDVSGSMHGRSDVSQLAVATIVSKLKPGDILSLVTYAREDRTVIKGYEIRDEWDKEELMGILFSLKIGGCTYGSAGIETAYRIGKEYYREDWNNQVILITDGDLNFGITEKGGLQELIEEKKKSGLFLSVIGTGLLNYKDDKLEVLSKHGNGTYCTVNELDDVEESVNRRYISLTNIVAKDVKAQVEFNPKFVKEYRLLGYENRQLQHEDFADDSVISEPYGSGGHGIALYELTMNNGEARNELKYQQTVLKDSDELGTVRVRYKEPLSDVSCEIEKIVYPDEGSGSDARLAYLLYCISEKLRCSDKLDEDDEQFLHEMLAKGLDEELLETNGEKLELFVDACAQDRGRHNSWDFI